jgi:hypothetical protein
VFEYNLHRFPLVLVVIIKVTPNATFDLPSLLGNSKLHWSFTEFAAMDFKVTAFDIVTREPRALGQI